MHRSAIDPLSPSSPCQSLLNSPAPYYDPLHDPLHDPLTRIGITNDHARRLRQTFGIPALDPFSCMGLKDDPTYSSRRIIEAVKNSPSEHKVLCKTLVAAIASMSQRDSPTKLISNSVLSRGAHLIEDLSLSSFLVACAPLVAYLLTLQALAPIKDYSVPGYAVFLGCYHHSALPSYVQFVGMPHLVKRTGGQHASLKAYHLFNVLKSYRQYRDVFDAMLSLMNIDLDAIPVPDFRYSSNHHIPPSPTSWKPYEYYNDDEISDHRLGRL